VQARIFPVTLTASCSCESDERSTRNAVKLNQSRFNYQNYLSNGSSAAKTNSSPAAKRPTGTVQEEDARPRDCLHHQSRGVHHPNNIFTTKLLQWRKACALWYTHEESTKRKAATKLEKKSNYNCCSTNALGWNGSLCLPYMHITWTNRQSTIEVPQLLNLNNPGINEVLYAS